MKHRYWIGIILLIVFSFFLIRSAASQSNALIALYPDNRWEWVNSPTPLVITATQGPTQTPWIITATLVASSTPTPTATNTPTATATPTNTPTVTFTPTVGTPDPFNTPTPELTAPPPTFTYTPFPEKECALRANRIINIRNLPNTTTSVIINKFLVGQEGVFIRFLEDNIYLWGEHRSGGWSVVAQKAPLTWWADGTQSSDSCFDVPGWPAWVPPDPIASNAALLWHTVPGFNISNAQNSYEVLRSKKIDFGIKPYAGMSECIDALARGGTCIYRHGAPDCPQNIGKADPRQSARDFLQYGVYARDMLAKYPKAYYEPLNECNFGGPGNEIVVYWWAAWLDEFITLAVARGYPKLVIPTFGPGHGDPMQYAAWKPALVKLTAAGGLLGEHAYTPYHDGGLCACDEWLACRHRKNEEYRQSVGLNISVAITEAARGWGNDPVSVKDFTCWYELIRRDPYVHSVSLWNAGFHPTWPNANLDNYMVAIAQGVLGLDKVNNMWDNITKLINARYY